MNVDNEMIVSDSTMQERSFLGWTTVGESERLIDAGLPEDTCDMWWAEIKRAVFDNFGHVVSRKEPIYHVSFVKPSRHNASCDIIRDIPCWTLGSLIDVLRNEFQTWNVTMDTKDVFATNGVYEWAFLESTLIENIVEALCAILNYERTETIKLLEK